MIDSDDHEHRDDVHDLALGSAGDVVEDPLRQRLDAHTGGERRDHDLVEAEREREQGAGEQRRADQRERDVSVGLEAVGAEVGGRFVELGDNRRRRARTLL